MGPKVDLKDFRWILERAKAIVAIGKEEGLGLTVAKNTYEKINAIVADGIYSVDSNTPFEDRNYICFLERLKYSGVLSYTEWDYHMEEQAERYRLEEETHAKAVKWLKSLSKEEQEMVQTLMNGMIPR